jgi:hypothetical protein
MILAKGLIDEVALNHPALFFITAGFFYAQYFDGEMGKPTPDGGCLGDGLDFSGNPHFRIVIQGY